jgi:hypothetical protein
MSASGSGASDPEAYVPIGPDWIVDRMLHRHQQVSVPVPAGTSNGRARPASWASALLRGGRASLATWGGRRRREPVHTAPGGPEERVGPRGATGWTRRPSDRLASAGTGGLVAGR